MDNITNNVALRYIEDIRQTISKMTFPKNTFGNDKDGRLAYANYCEIEAMKTLKHCFPGVTVDHHTDNWEQQYLGDLTITWPDKSKERIDLKVTTGVGGYPSVGAICSLHKGFMQDGICRIIIAYCTTPKQDEVKCLAIDVEALYERLKNNTIFKVGKSKDKEYGEIRDFGLKNRFDCSSGKYIKIYPDYHDYVMQMDIQDNLYEVTFSAQISGI